MAYIYAINRQVTDDVAVRQNIAKDTSWVRDRVKAFAIARALGFRCEFNPRSGFAVGFDPRGHRGSFFSPLFTGANITVILLSFFFEIFLRNISRIPVNLRW